MQAILFGNLAISMPALERTIQLCVKRFGLLSLDPQLPITTQQLGRSFWKVKQSLPVPCSKLSNGSPLQLDQKPKSSPQPREPFQIRPWSLLTLPTLFAHSTRIVLLLFFKDAQHALTHSLFTGCPLCLGQTPLRVGVGSLPYLTQISASRPPPQGGLSWSPTRGYPLFLSGPLSCCILLHRN